MPQAAAGMSVIRLLMPLITPGRTRYVAKVLASGCMGCGFDLGLCL